MHYSPDFDMFSTGKKAGETGLKMPPEMHNDDHLAKPMLNPTALSLADAAKVVSKAGGGAVTEEMIRADVELGAPLNADGTLNLVSYAAWLVREMGIGN